MGVCVRLGSAPDLSASGQEQGRWSTRSGQNLAAPSRAKRDLLIAQLDQLDRGAILVDGDGELGDEHVLQCLGQQDAARRDAVAEVD
jgi:hypothetical protein